MPNLTVSPDATGLSPFISTPAFGRMARGRVPAAKPRHSALRAQHFHSRPAPADTSAGSIVLFRADTDASGATRITAVFPCEPALSGEMLGYTRDEGYMTCSRLWFDLSRPATEAEADDLVEYLKRLGSQLDIRQYLTSAMLTARAEREEAEREEAEQSKALKTRAVPRREITIVAEAGEDRGSSATTDAPAGPLMPPCPLTREDFERVCRKDVDGVEVLMSWYSRDDRGIVRDPCGVPQTMPGFVSPLPRLDLHEDAPAVMAGVHIAMGLAAATWVYVSGERSTAGRDVLICLTEDACPVSASALSETLCIAEHELQPARDRVSYRMLREPDFATDFAEAQAMMSAGCAFFPWYRGDGSIPG